MAQADYIISNQTFPNTRADINNHLSAIATNNSGTSAPTTQYAGQFWIDTTSTTWTLYIHDGSDDIQFATIDTSANTVNFTDSALSVQTDPNPTLGGDLDLNSNDITGTGNINITGNATVTGNLSVNGGTIKLDGNYPTGTENVALGDTALDSVITGGNYNTAIGALAGTAITTGDENTLVGSRSGDAITTGSSNTAVGQASLGTNITGNYNTAIGVSSLSLNTASNNTAVGFQALTANTSGQNNVAVGSVALDANTTGIDNTALGSGALTTATTASENTGLGRQALLLTTTGEKNTAVGSGALVQNTTASFNTAVGFQSSYTNTTGTDNVSVGLNSLYSNSTGSYNTSVGKDSLYNNTASNNTAVGYKALEDNTSGTNNTIVGRSAGANITTASANTFIGKGAGESVTTGAKNTIIGLFNGNQGGLNITTSSNNIVLSDGDGNPRVRIDSAGRMRLNSTRTENNILIAEHSQADYLARFVNSNASTPFGIQVQYTDASPDNNDNQFFACTDSTANRLIIWSDGDVDNHDNSYSGFSDEKLKEQITDASSQWNDIKNLRVRKFKFKSDVASGDSDAHWKLGVIAQEIETVSPHLVSERIDRDAEMNDLGTTTKSVKYSILYMKAVKALQEAMQKIEDLEVRVNTLEGN